MYLNAPGAFAFASLGLQVRKKTAVPSFSNGFFYADQT